MLIENRSIVLEDTVVTAELQVFEPSDKKKLKSLYENWITLSSLCKELKGRRINIPGILSEAVFCIEFDCARLINCSGNVSSSFDCLEIENNTRIQVKATSVKEDLTSFGPRSVWDEIYFVNFFPNEKYDGSFYVYKIDDDLIYNHKVSRNETFKDQQLAGRRPRFSLVRDIIIPHNMKPLRTGNVLDY